MIRLGRAVVSILHNSVLALVEVLPILRNTVPIQKEEGSSPRNIALIRVKKRFQLSSLGQTMLTLHLVVSSERT